MQKQKINPLYLIITSDYTSVSCGLYQSQTCLDSFVEDKMHASKNLMIKLNHLIALNNICWQDISFIGVNCGPGPFTTLRVIITTANGLLLALNIPLIGIDGLTTFLNEYSDSQTTIIVLLNAFNNDVYFGIKKINGAIKTGWEFYATFLDILSQEEKNRPITFIGNGVILHKELIYNLFSEAFIPEPLPETVSLKAVSEIALRLWHEEKISFEPLLPLYLKSLDYKKST